MFKDNPDLCVERGEEWTLAQDVSLLKKLEDLSQKLISKTEAVLQNIENFESNITDTHLQMKNVSHKFLLLADRQFIEHRVNEDDDSSDVKVSDHSQYSAQDEASQALLHCLTSMESTYKKLNENIKESTVDTIPTTIVNNVSSSEIGDINQNEDELSESQKSEELENNGSIPQSTENVYTDVHDDLISTLTKKKNIFGSSSSDSEQSTTSDHQPKSAFSDVKEEKIVVPITEQLNRLLKQRFTESNAYSKSSWSEDTDSNSEEEDPIKSSYETPGTQFVKPTKENPSKEPSNGLFDDKKEVLNDTESVLPNNLLSIKHSTSSTKPKPLPKKEISLFDSDSSDEEPTNMKTKNLLPKKMLFSDFSDSDDFPFSVKTVFPADPIDDDIFSHCAFLKNDKGNSGRKVPALLPKKVQVPDDVFNDQSYQSNSITAKQNSDTFCKESNKFLKKGNVSVSIKESQSDNKIKPNDISSPPNVKTKEANSVKNDEIKNYRHSSSTDPLNSTRKEILFQNNDDTIKESTSKLTKDVLPVSQNKVLPDKKPVKTSVEKTVESSRSPDNTDIFSPHDETDTATTFPAKIKFLSESLKFPSGIKRQPKARLFSTSDSEDDEALFIKPKTDKGLIKSPKSVFNEGNPILDDDIFCDKSNISPTTPENSSPGNILPSAVLPASTKSDELPDYKTSTLTSVMKSRIKVTTARRPPSRYHRQKNEPQKPDNGTNYGPPKITAQSNEGSTDQGGPNRSRASVSSTNYGLVKHPVSIVGSTDHGPPKRSAGSTVGTKVSENRYSSQYEGGDEENKLADEEYAEEEDDAKEYAEEEDDKKVNAEEEDDEKEYGGKEDNEKEYAVEEDNEKVYAEEEVKDIEGKAHKTQDDKMKKGEDERLAISLHKEKVGSESTAVSLPSPSNVPSTFSPATDEEDLFLVPDFKFPRDFSFNLFQASLLSPGNSIGDNLFDDDDFDLFKSDLPKVQSNATKNDPSKKKNVESPFDYNGGDPLNVNKEIEIVKEKVKEVKEQIGASKTDSAKKIMNMTNLFGDSSDPLNVNDVVKERISTSKIDSSKKLKNIKNPFGDGSGDPLNAMQEGEIVKEKVKVLKEKVNAVKKPISSSKTDTSKKLNNIKNPDGGDPLNVKEKINVSKEQSTAIIIKPFDDGGGDPFKLKEKVREENEEIRGNENDVSKKFDEENPSGVSGFPINVKEKVKPVKENVKKKEGEARSSVVSLFEGSDSNAYRLPDSDPSKVTPNSVNSKYLIPEKDAMNHEKTSEPNIFYDVSDDSDSIFSEHKKAKATNET